MKISELIEKLEGLKELYGDIPVVVYDNDGHFSQTGAVTISYVYVFSSEYFDFNTKSEVSKSVVVFIE